MDTCTALRADTPTFTVLLDAIQHGFVVDITADSITELGNLRFGSAVVDAIQSPRDGRIVYKTEFYVYHAAMAARKGVRKGRGEEDARFADAESCAALNTRLETEC